MHTLDSKKAHVDLQNLDLEENDADAAAQLVVEKINQGVSFLPWGNQRYACPNGLSCS